MTGEGSQVRVGETHTVFVFTLSKHCQHASARQYLVAVHVHQPTGRTQSPPLASDVDMAPVGGLTDICASEQALWRHGCFCCCFLLEVTGNQSVHIQACLLPRRQELHFSPKG